jgi:hypothetical protein
MAGDTVSGMLLLLLPCFAVAAAVVLDMQQAGEASHMFL